MSDENPVRNAATNLYDRLSEQTDDVLDEACADTWPGGADEWFGHDGTVQDFEAHREATFRLIMGELAVTCMERSLGRYGGSPVETGQSS